MKIGKDNKIPKDAEYKLVYVEWEDAHGVSSEWANLKDCNAYNLIFKTVGWLLSDKKGVVVVASHINHKGQARRQGCGDMTIPKSCIQRFIVLKKAKKKKK